MNQDFINRIYNAFSLKPKSIIYFIGIGGIGMSGIAQILHHAGYTVYGSDNNENYIVNTLRSVGIEVKIGQKADNIPLNTDLIIYSSAIKNTNIELVNAYDYGIKTISRGSALALLVSSFANSFAIAGTHGKTTTTAMLAALMSNVDTNFLPTIVNGGFIQQFSNNAVFGNQDIIITEADESDKSFLLLPCKNAIITNIEPEHLENYDGDFNKQLSAYKEFMTKLPNDGNLVYCHDDIELTNIIQNSKNEINAFTCSYGITESADVQIITEEIQENKTVFKLKFSEKIIEKVPTLQKYNIKENEFFMNTYGHHNVLNMTGAIVMSLLSQQTVDEIYQRLTFFQGVKRRFSKIGTFHEMTVIDDYAHHPTEVEAVIKMARIVLTSQKKDRSIDTIKEKYQIEKDSNNIIAESENQSAYMNKKSERIIAVFQPHRYTRLASLMPQFAEALSKADIIIISDVYSAGEDEIHGVNAQNLIDLCTHYNCYAIYLENKNSLPDLIDKVGRKNDLILCMGAGDITNWAYNLASQK